MKNKLKINTRQDWVVFIICEGLTNPNGDPDNGNRPRIDSEGYGIMSDVCIKRKIRNRMDLVHEGEEGMGIMVQAGAYKQDKEKKYLKTEGKKSVMDIEKFCKDYVDVRAFGHVPTVASQNCGITGAIHVGIPVSFEPIEIFDMGIRNSMSCKTNTNSEGKESETGKVGMKHLIPHGLYRFHVSVLPHVAKKNNLTAEDVERCKEAIFNMCEMDLSASRSNMNVCKIVAFRHDNELGNDKRSNLFKRVSVKKKTDKPNSYEDYVISVNMDNLPKGISVDIME